MPPHHYLCCKAAVKWGEKNCIKVEGRTLDKAVEKIVLQVLESPPLETLKHALSEATRAEEIMAREIDAERQRIERRERLIRAQFDACDPKYHLVYDDLQEQLNTVLKEKKRFEERAAAERHRRKLEVTEENLAQLCSLASQVPQIWHHDLVTVHERKEIIRCIIKRIIVTTTPETIEAIIEWHSGERTAFQLYRWQSRKYLVKELHAQGYNSREILERLQSGQTSTGQKVNFHPKGLYKIYQKLGIERNRKPSWFNALRDEALELRLQGKSHQRIADLFNSRGLKSLAGLRWNRHLVSNLTVTNYRKPDFGETHYAALSDAIARGLNYRQIAQELNKKCIPRHDKRPWTPASIRYRWLTLKQTKETQAIQSGNLEGQTSSEFIPRVYKKT